MRTAEQEIRSGLVNIDAFINGVTGAIETVSHPGLIVCIRTAAGQYFVRLPFLKAIISVSGTTFSNPSFLNSQISPPNSLVVYTFNPAGANVDAHFNLRITGRLLEHV